MHDRRIIIDNRSSMDIANAMHVVAKAIRNGHKMEDRDELCPVCFTSGVIVVPVYNKASIRFVVEDI